MNRSILVWLVFLIISLSAIVLVAWRKDPHLHAIVASIIGFVWAGLGIAQNWSTRNAGANEFRVASETAQQMGFVWGWGAAALFLTYAFVIQWKEWITFVSAAAVVAVVCLAFSAILRRDGEKDSSDKTMLNLAWYLTVGQLVGMLAAVIGLVVDGKIPAQLKTHQAWQDWAANNIFFFGALALVGISANALYSMRTKPNA